MKEILLKVLGYFHNPELVGSMLLLYVVHMVSLTVNIPHSFLNGLKVIIAPTEEAVLKLRPDAKGPRPEPLRQKEKEGKDPDAYDKMNALGLVRMEISRGSLGTLGYFAAYDGMVTWSLVALGNLLVAQASRCALPGKRPIGWATLTLCAALLRAFWCNVRLLGLLGLDNDHSKFAAFCGFCGLFLAAAVGAMLPEDFFFFDLRGSASALHGWLGEAVAAAGLGGNESWAGISEADFTAMFLPAMAVAAACVTAAAALPSIRFAQYYQRALESGSGASLSYRALLVVDALLPWVVTLVWVRSIPQLFLGEGAASGAWTYRLRVGATGAAVVARLALGRTQLQVFLDGAKEAVLQELREKKVDVQAVRSKFEARFQYLVIAAAQYAAPALTVLLSIALFLHAGGYTASPLSAEGDGASVHGTSGMQAAAGGEAGLGLCDTARWAVGAESWREIVAGAGATIDSGSEGGGGGGSNGGSVGFMGLAIKVPGLPEAFFSGVAGFLAWWACFSWAATYAIGVVFWKIFPEEISVEERQRRDRTTKSKKEKSKGKAKAKAKGGGGGDGKGGAAAGRANGS